MVAVWILFAVGLLAIIVGLIPAILEVYAYIYAYIVTLGELLKKKKELRQERIKALKTKDIELKNEKDELVSKMLEANSIVIVDKDEEDKTDSNEATDLAKDIVNSIK